MNVGGTPATLVIAMLSVRKWLKTSPRVSALFEASPVPDDVNDDGSRNGVLIGVGATCVVSGWLDCCGMMWNQPSDTTSSPAFCAYALAHAQSASAANAGLKVLCMFSLPASLQRASLLRATAQRAWPPAASRVAPTPLAACTGGTCCAAEGRGRKRPPRSVVSVCASSITGRRRRW
ncbi:protein of unknown function [Paraburkholderia kururiensis]